MMVISSLFPVILHSGKRMKIQAQKAVDEVGG